ncbi:hypothetical protein QC764_310020 [Podospora pseudoanserina]|uniref:Uncharacterized protein n=1 Tax=Podospora pseudoanserina TaxID=2609844 RepID=A0ABR0IEZ5_9PEZI|nr:hypothetical protein QC764_310020 [Podospora pseudoanserina]
MAAPVCSRLLFRHDDNHTERLISWSPDEVTRVKKRSAFLKRRIVYLEVDSERKPEEISFQRQGEPPHPTSLTPGVSLSDFQGFLSDLASTGNIPSTFEHLISFCKCAWVCECPPDPATLPLQIFSRERGPDGRRDVIACKFDPISRDDRPWGLTRECEVYHGDSCVCSAELANIFLWFGWEHHFRKHLKLAIWTGDKKSVAILTPVALLQNLQDTRDCEIQSMRSDLRQYLDSNQSDYRHCVKDSTKDAIERYLANMEDLPARVGRTLEKLFTGSGEVNGAASTSPTRPFNEHRVSLSPSVPTSLSSGGSGAESSGPESASGSQPDRTSFYNPELHGFYHPHAAGVYYSQPASVNLPDPSPPTKSPARAGSLIEIFGFAGKIYKNIEKKEGKSDEFASKVLAHLAKGIEARQKKREDSIWAMRETKISAWKYELGIE